MEGNNNFILPKNDWIDAYFNNLSPANFEILNLTGRELSMFYQHNYYDDDKECFIMEKSDDKYVPLGMNDLSILPNNDLKYLIMVCKNKLGLSTIVASVTYIDKFHKRDDSSKDIITHRVIKNIDINNYIADKRLIDIFLTTIISLSNSDTLLEDNIDMKLLQETYRLQK